MISSNVIEALDNAEMAHLSIDLGARGTATHLTMPAAEGGTDEYWAAAVGAWGRSIGRR